MLRRAGFVRSVRCSSFLKIVASRPQCRLNSSAIPSTAAPGLLGSETLAGVTARLDRIAPRIDIRSDQIDVLEAPKDFYRRLKDAIRNAKKRVFLSTLYIGKTEHELISFIRDALSSAPELKVSILTDALRGTREDPQPSCASILASLVTQFPDRVEVRMYHTPNLTGLRKRSVPKRINEGWGLQHMKLYGFDDQIILSGANLSSDYFTNRQDRYHVFSSERVTQYYFNIHRAVCDVSFLLQPDPTSSSHTLAWPSSNPAPNPLCSPKGYIEAATSLLLPFTNPHTSSSSSSQPLPSFSSALQKTDTVLYPLLSHPPTINTELPVLRSLLSSSSDLSSYTFTAGYFNPHPIITRTLLALSSGPCPVPGQVLTASPFANGFYNSSGVSGLLPAAYTHLSLRFMQAARRARASIKLREWQRGIVGESNGWTYHAKGVWTSFPNSAGHGRAVGYSATVIGSSNYTTRSYDLDLEVGALLITTNESLMQTFKREEEALQNWTRTIGEKDLASKDRRAGWRVRAAMWIVRMLGGAL
ncbi:MAG: hypothetical protein Q9174_000427 [Haloplaca sp. 1 TL-2023]